MGDLLLMQTAERLRLCVRESDTLARLGGDEFTVLLNDAHERGHVEMLANKIINSIDQPFNLEGLTARIGASVGIARYPEDAQTAGTLLIVADKAMYAAKAAGENTYRFGTPGEATGAYSIPKRVSLSRYFPFNPAVRCGAITFSNCGWMSGLPAHRWPVCRNVSEPCRSLTMPPDR